MYTIIFFIYSANGCVTQRPNIIKCAFSHKDKFTFFETNKIMIFPFQS